MAVVASKNMFSLLEEEDSSRPSTPAAKSAPKEAAPAAAPATRGSQRGRGGPASKGGKYYQRGGKTASKEDAPEPADDSAGGDAKRRFDGEGRGRGRGRGRGGDRARGGRGRPFDKHSQTGKTDSDKKNHQGWGGDQGNTELKVEDAAANDAAAESFNGPPGDFGDWGTPAAESTDDWGVPAPPTGDAAAPEVEKTGEREGRRGRDREEEEEDKTITFDQYLKQQKGLDIVPKLESRKANEGDDSIWKDAVPVSKKDEEETAYFVGKSKSAPKARAKKDEKVYLEIEARFERPSRGGRGRGGDRPERGDRGGRGRGRGGGRGRANGNGAPASALDVDDQKAFPSLA